MIVLTTGPASLARLMRRDDASQHLAPGQVDGHQDQGDQTKAGSQAQGRLHPPGVFSTPPTCWRRRRSRNRGSGRPCLLSTEAV